MLVSEDSYLRTVSLLHEDGVLFHNFH
jgi:hypothetical protein